MSEIRPANNRPEVTRPQSDRAVKNGLKTDHKPQETSPHQVAARREVVKHEAATAPKLKGGHVDITV
jgi:hypothetical protein